MLGFLRKNRDLGAALLVLALLHTLLFPQTVSAAEVIIDSTVNTTMTSHNGTTFTNVFIDDQTGYAFYRDSNGTCAVRKTTDGGQTWGATQTLDTQTDCLRIAVWYGRWTPGFTTTTYIHFITIDSGSDDVWYGRYDTSNDSSTPMVNITGANQGGTFAVGSNLQALTMGRDGTLYAAINDGGDSFMLRCSATSSCTTTTTAWTEAGNGTTIFNLANNPLLLMPIKNNNILVIRWNTGANTIQSRIWYAASSSWGASWFTLDSCADNTTYDGGFGASVNKISGDVYLAASCDVSTLGTDDDVRTYRFNASNDTWASTTAVVTNATLANASVTAITGAKLGLDENTNNIYVVYTGRTVANSAGTGRIFYRMSTDYMQTWGGIIGPLNSTSGDIYGTRLDGNNPDRIYATWAINGILYGTTVADLASTSYSGTSYRFFGNLNGTSVDSPYAPTNATSSILPNIGQPFRLRMLIHATGTGIDKNGLSLKLQFATTSGPGGCDTSFSGETYSDVATSTGDIRWYDNSNATSGSPLTPTSTDPTHGTDTVVNQDYVEANPFTNGQAKILAGQDGKWDFSLYNASATPLTTYCFRIVKEDGSLFAGGYEYVAEAVVNSPPTIEAPILNGNTDVVLTPAGYVVVQATATVTDLNGSSDLVASNFSGRFYLSSVASTTNCTQDYDSCYDLAGACSLSGCATSTCIVTCQANFGFNTTPTDTGTPNASDTWRAVITAVDQRGSTSTASSTSPVEVLSLLAIQVTPSINYGTFVIGQSTSTNKLTHATSAGNVSWDLTLYGTDMTRPSSSIPVSFQRYSTTSGLSYASATPLGYNPGVTLDLNVPRATSSINPTGAYIYWGSSVPSSTRTGAHTGQNTFIAVKNPLPWP